MGILFILIYVYCLKYINLFVHKIIRYVRQPSIKAVLPHEHEM
jgi:hypothetical protein